MQFPHLFPTMVIGSLPRPRWVLEQVAACSASGADDQQFQKTMDKAVPFAIGLQEAAGIDVISDGEWRRQSYISGFPSAVEGFEQEVIEVRLLDGRRHFWPGVTGKLRWRRPIVADEMRFLRRNTSSQVKATLPSPYMIDRWFYDPDRSRPAYGSREELVQDAAAVLRREVVLLQELGVDVIQFDDAMIGRFVGEKYNASGANPNVKITMADLDRELEMAVWGLNQVVQGLEGVTTALHVCRGHRARKHVASGDFRQIAPYLYRSNVDILALEMAAPDAGDVEVFHDFPEDKQLGMGVIDVLAEDVDQPELVAKRARRALSFVDKERLVLNPDCGFAPSSDNPISIDEAFLKLKSLGDAARILRLEFR